MPQKTTPKNLDLDTPVQFVKGVGPARARAFANLGVNTVADLLEYFPRDYNFLPPHRKIADLRAGSDVTITALVESLDYISHRRPPMLEAFVADDTARCRIVWFHGGYLREKLTPGTPIIAWGKVTEYKHQLQFTNPRFTQFDPDSPPDPKDLSGGVYPASANLPSSRISRIIKSLLDQTPHLIDELFTPDFRKDAALIERPLAFRHIHAPPDDRALANAKRRLKYDELFLMQLGLALRRYRTHNLDRAPAMHRDEKIDRRIRKRFPFLLTEDQNNVIEQIVADLARPRPMNRLLQGDVGSGKTVVALYAALLAVANKAQVAIMAPTEILAAQHYISIERYLKNAPVKRALLTGSTPAKERADLQHHIRTGRTDIVAGTVALLSRNIDFHNLGLVIIDEQHKFGVHQRAGLRKSHTPHCLVMTATPIPRTLAMTAFGDLDVSTIRHAPPGRGRIITKWVPPERRPDAWQFIRDRLKAKKQAYLVCPRIAETDPSDNVKAATAQHRLLSRDIFPEFNVELLHGRMPARKKDEIMTRFRRGKIDLLVSTVVIEVGLDVPNATIMVIEGADHFGLAQLHQLRGRIARSPHQCYCLLFAETESDIAAQRLDVLTRTTDGFKIAEHDLRLRGPGELFSARQHGLPDLKIANLIDDYDLLIRARKDASDLVQKDPALTKPEHKNIRKALLTKFQHDLTLADIA